MPQKYDPYEIREKRQKLDTETEENLMSILMAFGESIDPQGYDDGDYDTAMNKLLEIIGEFADA